MNRAGYEETKYFIGPEVEHTPAYSKKTLFVVGYQNPLEVEKLARQHKTPHVFLGANHSFDTSHRTEYFDQTWNDLVTHLLDHGFWVTLDYQAHQHKDVLEMLSAGVWQSRLFVPLLGVRIPKVETSSPNLTIKIDDIDFRATNPGVWCLHFHEVTDSNRFTDWNDYGTDEDVSGDVATPMPPYIDPPKIPTKPIDLKELKTVPAPAPVVTTPVQNDATLGLDPDAPSKLKADDEQIQIPAGISEAIQTKQDVADLYTETETAGVAVAKKTTSKKK